MPQMDPFEGAKSEREDQRRQLLDVISTGGSAAEKAYKDAQAQVTQTKQSALDRASQRAQITGQDFHGADTEPVQQSAGLYNNYLAGQNAASQNLFGQIGASGESYLAKVGAIAPFMQQQNLTQAADRENQYKMAIAQAQAKVDAEKQKEIDDFARQKELLGIKNQYDIQNDQRTQSAAAAKTAAEAPSKITLNQLVGAARAQPGVTQDNQNILGQARGGENIQAANLLQRAGQIGSASGVEPYKLAGLTEPGFQKGLTSDLTSLAGGPAKAPQPPALSADWLRGPFRYEGKTISPARTAEVLKAPEVAQAQEFLPTLATLKLDPRSGRIIDTKAADGIIGKTPREAFNLWIDSLPGIRTMKTALKDYYGPYLDELGRV